MNPEQTISWDQVTAWLADPLVGGIVGSLAVVYVLGFTSIFARAGFHWSFGALMLVPGLNVALFLLISFTPWPNGRELRGLRRVKSAMNSVGSITNRAA